MEDFSKYIKDGITITGNPEEGYTVFTISTQHFKVSKLSELTNDRFERAAFEQKLLEDSQSEIFNQVSLDLDMSSALDELHQDNINPIPYKTRFNTEIVLAGFDEDVADAFHEFFLFQEKEKERLYKMNMKIYTEDDLISASKYGYEYRGTTSFPSKSFEDNCLNNTKQWISGVLDKRKGEK